MNILLLDPHNKYAEKLRAFLCEWDDVTVFAPSESSPSSSPDVLQADVIVACGDFSNGANVTGSLLRWRTHPHTYLVPCWIANDASSFERGCLWPRLAIDSFQRTFDATSFCNWLGSVTKWQHERTLVRESDSLAAHSALELLSSLALRKATGELSIFARDGSEGSLLFRGGDLIDGRIRNLSGVEVCYEFLSWSQGSYHWNPNADVTSDGVIQSLPSLIEEGLKLLHEANLLFSFATDVQQAVERTESEAALDDGGVPFYSSLKQLYALIRGKVTVAELLDASPLSRPRAMIALAKWLSLEDIQLMAHEPTIPPRRLLIVDDSPLMRRALQSVFSTDTCFQIVGSAENGVEALQLVDQLEPDVVTMDLQMPLMDGLTALKHIMVRRPLPVVVLSAFTGQTSPLTYQAFKYGAVDVLAKPATKGNGSGMTEHANDIRARVLQACSVRMEAARVIRRNKRDHAPSESQMGGSGGPAAGGQQTRKLVALICGAGGFPLLLKFTGALSGSWSLPPILACIAFPTKVIEALLPNLQEDSERDIELLRSDISLKPGVIYLQSHETCCKLSREGPNIRVTGNSTWPDPRRPFDACLTSAAETFGDDLLALVLSGTGNDGLEGMRQVRRDGGLAYALAPEACLNPELPKKILDLGLATGVGSITELLSLLGGLLSEGRRRCAV